MKLNRQLAFLPSLLFVIAGAFGQDVHYNYARGTNFSAYKTYQWVDTPGDAPNQPSGLPNPPSGLPSLPIGPPPNILGGGSGAQGNVSDDQLLKEDIKRAVDEQLAQKGLTKVEKNADLYVGYQAGVNEEKSINLFGSGWGGRGFGGMWDGSIQGQTSTIPIGALVVGLYDPAKKQLIWRGDASKTVDVKKDPDKNYKNLQKAMTKLFKNYPPQPNK
jgi:hypothetical protein